MTIAKGVAWETQFDGNVRDLPIVNDNTDVSGYVAERAAVRLGAFPDLNQTLGGTSGGHPQAFSCDALRITDALSERWTIGSLIMRSPTWKRGILLANAPFFGKWHVAPKGHCNDGKIDVLSWRLPMQQRMLVSRRLRSGSHLPHPNIEYHRVDNWSGEAAGYWAYLNHRPIVLRGTVNVDIIPDALQIVVGS